PPAASTLSLHDALPISCDGADGVPDLHWSAGPPGTKSFALQLFDPDAPHGGFTHWMLANEGSELRQPTPGTGVSGKNDFRPRGRSEEHTSELQSLRHLV